jgi:uncharacterized protein YjbJ (UPF0337 family)
MDKDRKGSAEQAKGSVKEAAAKIFGDKKLETEGNADKATGKVQNAFGGSKDLARVELRHHHQTPSTETHHGIDSDNRRVSAAVWRRRILGPQPRSLVTDVSHCSEMSRHRRVHV